MPCWILWEHYWAVCANVLWTVYTWVLLRAWGYKPDCDYFVLSRVLLRVWYYRTYPLPARLLQRSCWAVIISRLSSMHRRVR